MVKTQKTTLAILLVFSFLFSGASSVQAADGIRKTINFQGKLVDDNGLNVADGNYTVVFTLYNDPSAGSNLWDETQTVATVDGVFQVELGTIDTTLGNVNFNSDLLYLGIKVGADAEMTPRIRFTAVPYAFNAQKVNGLTVTNTSGNPFSSATTLQIAEGKTVTVSNGLTLAGTDSTTITFQGTDTYVGRTTTDTLTNKTIGSTGLTFSGATTDITTGTNEDLTFTLNGSGDLVINADFNSGVSIGSASNTPAVLSVSGGIGSNASLIVNQTNSGDLFVASSAGITKFAVDNSGNVRITNLNSVGCDLKADTSGLLSCGTDLAVAGGTNPWFHDAGSGVIRPINSTMDVLLGGDATGSAKFAFNMNINTGLDPMASFSGHLRLGAKNTSTTIQQTTWTKVSNTTPGTIASGGTANIASISAMATYNGSIYVGTYGTSVGNAEVYRYSGTNSTWSKVSQTTAGQIASGGTQNIASVSAMTVYDGKLYVGTSKMNEAELYRYEGGTTWVKVSGAAGTFGTVTAQDGVSALAVYNGSLFVGTREGLPANAAGTGARLLRWAGGIWTPINTTAGQFVATNTVGVHAVSNIVSFNNTLFLGLSKAGDSDVVRYTGGAGAAVFLSMNTANLTGGFNINGTATAAYASDEITSMIVYNNTLVIGTRKNNAADVLMLNYSPVATTADQPWTRLNHAAGQLANGGTSAIDQIASMIIYNGMLYLGTREGNSAEIYRYTGNDQRFFKVSQTTAGTIASGGTSGIDGVVKLLASNGDLYAGTMELGRAEIYKHTSSIDRSYGLEFVANPQLAGGTQGTNLNHASIFYLASASANLSSNNGNTGAFIFSHGIQTRNGSYDVAEDYPTRDTTLEPGDVVSIDTNERGFVKKSEGVRDYTVIGVYSADPALRLSQADALIDGARAVPIALAGRVAVKVSTQNGEIKPGDYLTSSSTPGVAMKATTASSILGQAMGGYNEEGVGMVLTYIKSSSYNGSIADKFASFEIRQENEAGDILTALASQTPEGPQSEIVTDKLVAGLRIVSPEIVANNIQAGTITVDKLIAQEIEIPAEAWRAAFEQGGLQSVEVRITDQEARIANLESKLASATATVTDKQASLSGSLLAESSEGERERTLGDDVTEAGKLIVTSVQVTGSAIIEGIVHVVDTLTVRDFIVDNLATFLGNVIFNGDVFFAGRPTFNNDTAGIAIVEKGADRVAVQFEKAYKTAPMVNVNLTLDEVSPMPSEEIANLTRRQDELEQRILHANVRYVITQRTTKGFVILLDKQADEEIAFSWIVVAVDNPLVHKAHGDNSQSIEGHVDENARPISSSIPTIIPTSSIEKREIEILPSPKENLEREEVNDNDSD